MAFLITGNGNRDIDKWVIFFLLVGDSFSGCGLIFPLLLTEHCDLFPPLGLADEVLGSPVDVLDWDNIGADV